MSATPDDAGRPADVGTGPGGDGGPPPPRPALVCRALLEALEASEGRRRQRKRDQRPDAIGLGIKRTLLERAVQDDPAPESFEGWLLEQCLGARPPDSVGSLRAMALQILDEWRLACAVDSFDAWLAAGAPSEDRTDGERRGRGGGTTGPVLALPGDESRPEGRVSS